MLSQPFAAFESAPGKAVGYTSLPLIGTAAFVVIAFVCMRLRWSLASRALQTCNAGIASLHRSNIRAPCLFAPLARTISGMPLPSRTMCRLEPTFPLTVGLRPDFWPPEWALKSQLCWPGSNRFGRVHASASALTDATSNSRVGLIRHQKPWQRRCDRAGSYSLMLVKVCASGAGGIQRTNFPDWHSGLTSYLVVVKM